MTTQQIPEGIANLIIVAIPKMQAAVVGYAGLRPISLYEVIMKLATGSVHNAVSELLQKEQLLHANQFFAIKHCFNMDENSARSFIRRS